MSEFIFISQESEDLHESEDLLLESEYLHESEDKVQGLQDIEPSIYDYFPFFSSKKNDKIIDDIVYFFNSYGFSNNSKYLSFIKRIVTSEQYFSYDIFNFTVLCTIKYGLLDLQKQLFTFDISSCFPRCSLFKKKYNFYHEYMYDIDKFLGKFHLISVMKIFKTKFSYDYSIIINEQKVRFNNYHLLLEDSELDLYVKSNMISIYKKLNLLSSFAEYRNVLKFLEYIFYQDIKNQNNHVHILMDI